MIEVLNGDGKNPFFINQPYIYDGSNGFFEQQMQQMQQDPNSLLSFQQSLLAQSYANVTI